MDRRVLPLLCLLTFLLSGSKGQEFKLRAKPKLRIGQRDGRSLESAVLVQVLSLVQQLDSKLAAMERRLGDKMEGWDRHDQSGSSVQNVFDKIDQLDVKLSAFILNVTNQSGKELAESWNDTLKKDIKSLKSHQENAFEVLGDQIDAIEDSLANISVVISSVDGKMSVATSDCPQINLTEALGDWNVFAERLYKESLASVREELLRDLVTVLESAVCNGTDLALPSQHPKRCERGMTPALPQHPYPYPLITPDMTGSDLTVPYLCDTLTNGGGWIVIQRRTTGNTAFNRNWEDYKDGFGSLDDDFWLGNDNIHTLTSAGTWELQIDLKAQNKVGYAHYARFFIADERDNYRLTVEEYSDNSTLQNRLRVHNGMQFSTVDEDNDLSVNNCAERFGGDGGWWYRRCDSANLNGRWNDARDNGIDWVGFTNRRNITVDFSEMKIRRIS